MNLSSSIRGWLFGPLALLAVAAFAAEDVAKDAPISLPVFTVTDSRELPPPEAWRHVKIPNFEILSNASDRETQRLLRSFQQFNEAIGVVWPALIGRSPTPTTLILCGRGGKFDAFVPVKADGGPSVGLASLFLRNAERSTIIVDLQTRELGLAGLEGAGGVENNGFIEVDSYKQLYREYVHSLLSREQPRMAAWLEEGLAQLLMSMKFSPTLIEFAKLEDPNAVSISQANAATLNSAAAGDDAGAVPLAAAAEDRDFNAALARSYLMPLQEMFAVTHDSPVARNPIGSKWAKQATAFVHMCLYQTGKRHQKGFVTFITRSAREPVTEALFQECFGKSYRDMLIELRGYLDFTNYTSLGWSAKKGEGFPDPAPLALRDATESEVGRIKGEALLLAEKPEAARAALIAPYTRGERDPQLLAALGLYERAAGRDDRAAKFLEAATAAKVVRPLAYLELARVRFAAAKAQPGGADGKLSPTQTNAIVGPLLVARTQPPSTSELYELVAESYVRSEAAPKAETLAVLVEGVQLYPRRLGLVYQTAVLCLYGGEVNNAALLIEHGLRYAPTGAPQARFAALRESLPPGAAAAAKAKAAAPAKS
jgi:hypothetical protein